MPIRCKSCGFLNKDTSKSCERCSFDLRYSVIFDKAIENETNNPKMLFDIEQEPKIEENQFDDIQSYEVKDSDSQIETDNLQEDDETTDNFINLKDDYSTEDYTYNKIKGNTEFQQKKYLLSFSVEIMIFMIVHLFFYLITKFFFPNLHIKNSILLTVTIFFYLFLNTYAFIFKGKILSLVFLEKNFK